MPQQEQLRLHKRMLHSCMLLIIRWANNATHYGTRPTRACEDAWASATTRITCASSGQAQRQHRNEHHPARHACCYRADPLGTTSGNRQNVQMVQSILPLIESSPEHLNGHVSTLSMTRWQSAAVATWCTARRTGGVRRGLPVTSGSLQVPL